MKAPITQQQAQDLFDLPSVYLYVCDGKLPCGKPSCLNHSRADCCHHTSDVSHALYRDHDEGAFARYPATRNGKAETICVEPIRGM